MFRIEVVGRGAGVAGRNGLLSQVVVVERHWIDSGTPCMFSGFLYDSLLAMLLRYAI